MQGKHYNGRTYTRTPVRERLWARVDQSDPAACWEWPGSRSAAGYGQIGAEGPGLLLTHRVAYEDRVGPIPVGYFVCHHCDNPPCCNPAHLFAGTRSDNARDMVAKGRNYVPRLTGEAWRAVDRNLPRGERHHYARVTNTQVEEIRRRYAAGGITQEALGAEYGLSQVQIGRMVRRETYA